MNRRFRANNDPSDAHLKAMCLHPFFEDLGFVKDDQENEALRARGTALLKSEYDRLEQARRQLLPAPSQGEQPRRGFKRREGEPPAKKGKDER